MPHPRDWLDVLRGPAFVVNLERRPERLAAARARLRGAGFTDVRRFAATDGARPSALAAGWSACGYPLLARWDETFQRWPGRQGCFISHVRLWQQIVADGLPHAAVFQDDILFHRHFAALAPTYFAVTPRDYDLLYLGNATYDGREGLVLRVPCFCLHATVVTLEGARRILDVLLGSPRGVFRLDVMLWIQQRAERERGRPCAFDWYAWNGMPFPDPRGRTFPEWPDHNTGLVFQDLAFDSDLRSRPWRHEPEARAGRPTTKGRS